MAKENKSRPSAKSFLGMPMRWEREKIFKNIWNINDDRIFPPKYFGIGWDLNFHALLKNVGVIKLDPKSESK